ncbi:hypothetical protein [Peristeroidobacter agariperforans]|uniref:hypothetical protein n=1 Tax=Peristeroidobacter agariperforans TaxID=268404 RepID=UPI0013008E8E|nr:hypothetical protein [Peristeroidobacter agariperforans]
MKQKTEERKDEEVQGIEVIDLGDASAETKQNGFPQIPDSCCTLTFDWLSE